jgi:hypothetical protein
MPSSISSSEPVITATRSYLGPILWALASVAVLLVGFEAWTRFAFSRVSRIESRTRNDHSAALAARHGSDSRPTILLLGNSLLLEALDYDRLLKILDHDANPIRFTVEQTDWLDWYYGIRRLLAEGSRPDRIVLCLNAFQLRSNRIRGDYSSYYLFQTRDLMQVGAEAGYSLTKISSMYFAHYSVALAGSNSFRNFVLNKIAPSYGEVLHNLRDAPRVEDPKTVDVLAGAVRRLESLQSVCRQYHTRCDILLPPGTVLHGEAEESLVVEAGRRTATTVLIPVRVNEWGPEMYRDGFHATPEAAVVFTDLLAKALRQK